MELVVGRIVKSHGVRGEVAVDLRTDSPEERFARGAVLTVRRRAARAQRSAAPETLTIEAARNHSGRLLVRFEGVSSRESADALRGVELTVDSSSLAPLEDDDEYYDHQLEGLRVVLGADPADAAEIGRVVEVLHTAAGEILSLRLDAAGDRPERDVLVPFLERFVPEVDLGAGRVRITPPDGLLELDEPEATQAPAGEDA